MIKFKKNREVDSKYLIVPVKYITNYPGSNHWGCDKFRNESYEEWTEKINEVNQRFPEFAEEPTPENYTAWKEGGYLDKKLEKKGKDKTLCIIDFYGKNWALVAWRNNNTGKVGMVHKCRVVTKNDKEYIKYRGNLILISDHSGWVF